MSFNSISDTPSLLFNNLFKYSRHQVPQLTHQCSILPLSLAQFQVKPGLCHQYTIIPPKGVPEFSQGIPADAPLVFLRCSGSIYRDGLQIHVLSDDMVSQAY